MSHRFGFSLAKVALCSIALLGCRSGDESKSAQNSRQWTFQLSLLNGEQLSESSSTDALNLLAQAKAIKYSRAFFLDPFAFSENPDLMTARLTAKNQSTVRVYRWTPELNKMSSVWKDPSCSSPQSTSACEHQPLISCLQRQAEEAVGEDTFDDLPRSGQSRSLLLEWSRRCGAEGVFGVDSVVSTRFSIQKDQVVFEPGPVLSVLVYPGVWTSYEDAVVQAKTAASLPAVVPCTRADGACLTSPQPVSACVGCSALVKGQFYTVFFIETLRQDYSSVKSTVYVP